MLMSAQAVTNICKRNPRLFRDHGGMERWKGGAASTTMATPPSASPFKRVEFMDDSGGVAVVFG